MEQEDVFHKVFNYHVQLDSSVMEMEIAFLSQQQFQLLQHQLQVHVLAKVILMSYKKK
jgi:hypothetical protein